jgi:hypothetical protein
MGSAANVTGIQWLRKDRDRGDILQRRAVGLLCWPWLVGAFRRTPFSRLR